jgi:hypothetical protein
MSMQQEEYAPKQGSEIEVGDIIVFMGEPHKIRSLRAYTHPVVTGGEPGWRTASVAKSHAPRAWGITLEPQCTYDVML